jgi:hypothetical protein
MHEAALEYGIVLKDLAVIDRQFKGEIASTMDKVTSSTTLSTPRSEPLLAHNTGAPSSSGGCGMLSAS